MNAVNRINRELTRIDTKTEVGANCGAQLSDDWGMPGPTGLASIFASIRVHSRFVFYLRLGFYSLAVPAVVSSGENVAIFPGFKRPRGSNRYFASNWILSERKRPPPSTWLTCGLATLTPISRQ